MGCCESLGQQGEYAPLVDVVSQSGVNTIMRNMEKWRTNERMQIVCLASLEKCAVTNQNVGTDILRAGGFRAIQASIRAWPTSAPIMTNATSLLATLLRNSHAVEEFVELGGVAFTLEILRVFKGHCAIAVNSTAIFVFIVRHGSAACRDELIRHNVSETVSKLAYAYPRNPDALANCISFVIAARDGVDENDN
jgi:hypothetical protein